MRRNTGQLLLRAQVDLHIGALLANGLHIFEL